MCWLTAASAARPCAANERTFLAWLSMATTLGTISTAIAGFAVDEEGSKHGAAISQGTVELMTVTLLPISILMIACEKSGRGRGSVEEAGP